MNVLLSLKFFHEKFSRLRDLETHFFRYRELTPTEKAKIIDDAITQSRVTFSLINKTKCPN